MSTEPILGLRTVVYPAPDLDKLKAWYTAVLGTAPYFDEPFYVGFNVGGYELGLDPSADPLIGPITLWGVGDAERAVESLVAKGATPADPVREVGDGIRIGTVRDPAGSIFGVIENPHFTLSTDQPTPSGAGR